MRRETRCARLPVQDASDAQVQNCCWTLLHRDSSSVGFAAAVTAVIAIYACALVRTPAFCALAERACSVDLCVMLPYSTCVLCWPVIQVYLITELVTGGELLEAVLQRGTYSEAEARLAFVQLLKGIEYLHSKCVCSGAGCRHGQSAA